MNRPFLNKGWKISWTAFWSVVASLLIMRWVRSYSFVDFAQVHVARASNMSDDSAEYIPLAVALIAIGIALELMVFMTSAPKYLLPGLTFGSIVAGPALAGAGLTLPSDNTVAGAFIGTLRGAVLALFVIVRSV